MAQFKLQKKDEKLIGSLVDHFSAHIDDFELLLKGLRGHILVDRDLAPCIHSVKWRVKSPDGLRDKLVRKMQEAEGSGKPFGITTANLFKKINDLAGFRILHLHTQQMERINKALLARLSEALYVLREGPIADQGARSRHVQLHSSGRFDIQIIRRQHVWTASCEATVLTADQSSAPGVFADHRWGQTVGLVLRSRCVIPAAPSARRPNPQECARAC